MENTFYELILYLSRKSKTFETCLEKKKTVGDFLPPFKICLMDDYLSIHTFFYRKQDAKQAEAQAQAGYDKGQFNEILDPILEKIATYRTV